MARMVFEWDPAGDAAGNVAHIAAHGITTEEAEYVVRDYRNPIGRSHSSGYPAKFGRTKTGKYIIVVFSSIGTNPETIRVITSYEVQRPNRS
jgi:uncharacterized DUF497 family protein